MFSHGRYAEVQFIPGCSRHRSPAVAEGAVEILTLSTVNAVIKAKVVYRLSDCQRCYQSQGYPLIINGVVEATLPLKRRSEGFGKGKKRRWHQ